MSNDEQYTFTDFDAALLVISTVAVYFIAGFLFAITFIM